MLNFNESELRSLLPNCHHLTCIAHILNLVAKVYMKYFTLAMEWCSKFAEYFSHSDARKHRYQTFCTDIGSSKALPPQPVSTRWTLCFLEMLYHAENL